MEPVKDSQPWTGNRIKGMAITRLAIFILAGLLMGCANRSFSPAQVEWQLFRMERASSLRGISAVSDEDVWVCGNLGFCAHTTDGGKTWTTLSIFGADSADFRDVHAFPNGSAYLLSVGTGAASAIYKTKDAGQTWQLQLRNPFEEGFFSAMAFWDEQRGLVFSDPVGGKFVVFRTEDGGEHWQQIPPEALPAAQEGEYAFAGSGTCLVTWEQKRAAFVTGGSTCRVFLSADSGRSWQVTDTPVQSGSPSAGGFSLAFAGSAGVLVGGDYRLTALAGKNVAVSSDNGKTWAIPEGSGQVPFQSCIVSLDHWLEGLWTSVGPDGCYYSQDYGKNWAQLSEQGFHTAAVAPGGQWVWIAGANGRVARFRWLR